MGYNPIKGKMTIRSTLRLLRIFMPDNNDVLDGYHELDVVRITAVLSGNDPYTGRPVVVPAGEMGTVILGEPGRDTYDVEFLLRRADGRLYSAVLIVPVALLEPWQ
jgi:hypothetical protein